MNYFKLNSIYTVIDIGTTKICTIIAEKTPDNKIEILGIGMCPSLGLSKGIVVDVIKASESIKKSLKEAQIMAEFTSDTACIGISGSHIRSYYSQGMTTTQGSLIKQSTIDQALTASRAISLPDGEKLLHVMPITYTIDGITHVQNPLGMHGMRLEVTSHIITAHINAMNDLIHCCELAGIRVYDIVLEPIASGYAVLNNDEKNIGTLMIDIGGGTSDVAFYNKGSLQYTHIIPMGGELFTSDLSRCLRISYDDAEILKKTHGMIYQDIEEYVTVKTIDGYNNQQISTYLISDILAARAEEILYNVVSILQSHAMLNQKISGVVLTGGGALLKGFSVFSENILRIPTRIGYPQVNALYNDVLDHPSYTTAYGLALYAIQNDNNLQNSKESIVSKMFWRIRSWFDTIV